MTTATNTATHPLVTAHAEAITARENAQTAGVKAGATTKIANLELEMTIEGVEFHPWSPPVKVSTRRPSRSDADLMARLDVVRQIAASSKYAPSIRATADRETQRLTAQAVARGLIADPESPAPAPKPKRNAGKQLGKVEKAVKTAMAAA
jgi:hypothetical protein